MARIRKCKISWEASDSDRVIGYKLYWSKGTEVSYDARYLKVGNVTEIVLPDDITLADGPVMFGVTAIDRDGNESDMVTIDEPYRLHVPAPPTGLCIRYGDEFRSIENDRGANGRLRAIEPTQPTVGDHEDPLARAIEDDGTTPSAPGQPFG